MRAIVLAAGEGTRLRPLTNDKPKCLVEYRGKPILDYTLEALRACGVKDIVIVAGYKAEVISRDGVQLCINEEYTSTNMVATLFCAERFMDDDLIISYGDIVYGSKILQALIEDPHPCCLAVDKDWRTQWEARMEDPLSDAETMRISDKGFVTELGKRPNSYDDIQGQYVGLIKFKKELLPSIREFYYGLDPTADYRGKDLQNMYMTTFLQLIIDQLHEVHATQISGGWLEIDAPEDLNYQLDEDLL